MTEVTRGGTPVRTGRFMASRVVALVEHPALEGDGSRVEVETRRRMTAGEGRRRGGSPAWPVDGGRPTTSCRCSAPNRPPTELLREIEADTADDLSDG